MEKKINKTRHDLLYTVQRNLYKIIEWKVSLPRNTLVDKLVRRNDEGVRTSMKRPLNAITYTRITYTIRNAMFPPTFAFLSAMLIRSRDHRQSRKPFVFIRRVESNLVARWIEGSWNSCLEKRGTRINESWWFSPVRWAPSREQRGFGRLQRGTSIYKKFLLRSRATFLPFWNTRLLSFFLFLGAGTSLLQAFALDYIMRVFR